MNPILNIFSDKQFLRYLFLFLGIFAFCYLSCLAVIGLSAPGGLYSPFVDRYLDFISILRYSLLAGTKYLLSLFEIETYYANEYVLRKVNGNGIRMVYSCIGYGVMSFWIAFTVVNNAGWKKKLLWMAGGLILIWMINVVRLTLVLLSSNSRFTFPLFDHHTWFNIFAYLVIFILIYFYTRSSSVQKQSISGKIEINKT